MKTPEEIKYALRWCYAKDGRNECFGCPYRHKDCDDALYADAFSYIQQLEDHIRGLTKMVPHWISVKDRLPEYEQDVLLIAHGWKGQCLYIGRLQHMKAETSWLTGITSQESDWCIAGWSYLRAPYVTHWMPLPELPKEVLKWNGK